MAEFTRISLRESIEHTRSAHAAAQGALDRLSEHGASSATTTLAGVCADLAQALHSLQLVDDFIKQKAGLLPDATSGGTQTK
jgi:hypothetical protein